MMDGMAFVIDRAGPLQKLPRTPNGGYVVRAVLAKVGVLKYGPRDACGAIDCLNTEDALKANAEDLRLVPVTNRHPKAMVTTDSYQAVAAGHVVGDPEFKDGALHATLAIQDSDLIADIESGIATEISMGYYPHNVEEKGVFDGVPYTHKRERILWNHIAVVPAGRAGSTVRLVLDSVEIPQEDEDMKLKIRGKEYTVETAQDAIGATEALLEQAQADLKAAQDAKAEVERKLAEATSPAAIDAHVKAAMDAKEAAVKASERKAAVAKAFPHIALDGRTDAQIEILFEAIPAEAPKAEAKDTTDDLDPAKGVSKEAATDSAPRLSPREAMLARQSKERC